MKTLFDFDYNNSIVSASSSILKHYNVPTLHQTSPVLDEKLNHHKKNVILLILDGMGVDLIAQNLPETSFIRQNLTHSIYSVFPPTTTAATTAWHTGLTPLESGWIGWMCYYPQYDEFIENFRNKGYYNGNQLKTPFPVEDILKNETIYSKIVKANPSVEYHKIFPPFEKDGVNSFDEMCQKIIAVTKATDNQKIISAYWTEPDSSAHKFGVKNEIIRKIMENIDKNLQLLDEALQDSLLIVSADHGEIDVEEIYLNIYPELCETFVRPPALEARFLTFFIKEDKKRIFEEEFDRLFGGEFVLYTREQFLKTGLLGSGKMHPQILKFLGNYLAISVSNRSLRYTTGEVNFPNMKAEHAGISDKEMLIPLIMIEK